MNTIRLAALAAATALTTWTAAQAAEVELRLSHWVPATHPIQSPDSFPQMLVQVMRADGSLSAQPIGSPP